MNQRKAITPLATINSQEMTLRAPRKRADDRSVLLMLLVGVITIVIGWNFVQIGLNILNLPYFCMAFGMGITISALITTHHNKIIKKRRLVIVSKEPLLPPIDNNEQVNANEKSPAVSKPKDNNIPILAKIRRGYEKKQQQEKYSFSRLKSWFSLFRLKEKWSKKQVTPKKPLDYSVSDTSQIEPEASIEEKSNKIKKYSHLKNKKNRPLTVEINTSPKNNLIPSIALSNTASTQKIFTFLEENAPIFIIAINTSPRRSYCY